MIRAQRQSHRWIWLALALLLPALLWTAVRARTSLPLEVLPPALAPAAQPSDDADDGR